MPAGQLLLLPHHKLFTPQHISKLANYGISFAGKRAFLSFHRVALCVELAVKWESGHSAWAGLAGGMLYTSRYCEEGKRCEGLAAMHPHVCVSWVFKLSVGVPACLMCRVFYGAQA